MQKNDNSTVLGTEDVKNLLIKYSIPAIVAMMAASLYNIVDSIFIGQGLGSLAISGLAITFPLMNISAAFGSLVGVGGAAIVSIKMGQKDILGATKTLGNVFTLSIIIGILVMCLGLAFLTDILYFFGASENTIFYAREYMQIILSGNIITHLYFGLNNVMRASGYPQKAMITTLLAVVMNAILDPIFIFVLGLGIRGVAIATVIAQIIALVWVTSHFINKKSFIHFHRGTYKLKKQITLGIFSIGMSPFMINICACLVVILINQALKQYAGDLAIGAYGIANRLMMLVIMLVLGLTQGMQPIVGYNFGAKQYGRVTLALKKTITYATAVTTIAFCTAEIFPKQLAMMFTHDIELINYTVPAIQIVFMMFPIIGSQVVTVNFFQSIGKAKKSVFLSTTRQLIFLVPLILLLPGVFGLKGVWFSMPISDLISTIIAFILLKRQLKYLKKIRQPGIS